MFTYNYLNLLKDNFSQEEFEHFMKENQIENPFTTTEINNPYMMKYG